MNQRWQDVDATSPTADQYFMIQQQGNEKEQTIMNRRRTTRTGNMARPTAKKWFSSCSWLMIIVSIAFRTRRAGGYQSYNNTQYRYNNNYQQQQNQKYGNNQYYGNNNQYSNNYNKNNNNNRYGSAIYSGTRDFSVCDDSVVRVTALYAVCDSPYTFYYGNGANRNSPVCNYGDKLSFEVDFQVVDDIQDASTIFVTMAVYDDQGNLLVSVDPVYLCDDLVGYDCTSAGYYGFTYYRLRLPYPYEYTNQQNSNGNYDGADAGDDAYDANDDGAAADDGNAAVASSSSSSSSGQFLPQIQLAFSTMSDSGYNLGGLNMECRNWGNDNENYVEWSKYKPMRSPVESFFVDYGMLLGSCLMVLAVAAFVYHQASKVKVKEQLQLHVVQQQPTVLNNGLNHNGSNIDQDYEVDEGSRSYKALGLMLD